MTIEPDGDVPLVLSEIRGKHFQWAGNPLAQDSHGRFMHNVLCQRWHFERSKCIVALVKLGSSQIAELHIRVEEVLFIQRRIKAGIILGTKPPRSMTL